MKKGLFAATVILAACATPQSRIRKHQAEFDSYPAQVQAAIKQGKVDVGFSAAQVELAVGKADRVYTRKTASASQEIWAYGSHAPNIGVGFGVSSGYYGNYGGGVGIETGAAPREDLFRVVFESGTVVTVEKRER